MFEMSHLRRRVYVSDAYITISSLEIYFPYICKSAKIHVTKAKVAIFWVFCILSLKYSSIFYIGHLSRLIHSTVLQHAYLDIHTFLWQSHCNIYRRSKRKLHMFIIRKLPVPGVFYINTKMDWKIKHHHKFWHTQRWSGSFWDSRSSDSKRSKMNSLWKSCCWYQIMLLPSGN